MMTEDDLDGLFAAAKTASPLPSQALTARVLADADAVLAVSPRVAMLSPRPSLWSALASIFGGGRAMAGMVTATVAGFYIGFAQPMDTGIVSAVLGGEIAELDMMPGIDALLDEAP